MFKLILTGANVARARANVTTKENIIENGCRRAADYGAFRTLIV
jgi:hypothetical protein